jgi:NADH-quinone oxidoreductase subunit N
MKEMMEVVLPWVVLSGGILVTLLVSVIRVGPRRPAQVSALLTLILSGVLAVQAIPLPAEPLFAGAMEVSSLTRIMTALFCLLGVFFVLGGARYLEKEGIHIADYYHLLLLLILGASIMVSAKDLVVLFIALEVMSLPAYTLAGLRRNDTRSNEAAIKYFILGGAMGAVFLLGVAFLFGATGSTAMGAIHHWTRQSATGANPLFALGHFLVLVAFGFKVASAPFHFWKPDVYEGAPTPVTGIMATLVTAASFVTLTRLVHLPAWDAPGWEVYTQVMKAGLRGLAALSLLLGSVVVITQKNLKRLFAYSSISQTGYLLLGLLAGLGSSDTLSSVLIYLFSYVLTAAGLFLLLSQSEPRADTGVELVDLTGLFKRSPLRTFLWTVLLFSMAGMPFTVGFFSKTVVFLNSVRSGELPLVVCAALCTVIGAYAYLRPVALMTMRDADPSAARWSGGTWSQVLVVVAVIAVLFLGLMPNAMLHYLKGIPLLQ